MSKQEAWPKQNEAKRLQQDRREYEEKEERRKLARKALKKEQARQDSLLREKLKQAAKKFEKEWVKNDHEVEVDYDLNPPLFGEQKQYGLQQLEHHDNYKGCGKKRVAFKMFKLSSHSEKEEDLEKEGYRYATVIELYALLEMNPEIFEGQKIITPGSSITIHGEGEFNYNKVRTTEVRFPMLYTERKKLTYSDPMAKPGYEDHVRWVESFIPYDNPSNDELLQNAYLLAAKKEETEGKK